MNDGLIDDLAALGHVELLDREVGSSAPLLVSNGDIEMLLRATSPSF
jgi:hypothetical protein